MPALTTPVQIDVWSDYVCPFCYLELPVLDEVRQEYGSMVTVTWRAFELRPDPVPTLDPAGDYLRTTWARAVYPMAEERGMTLRLPPVQPRSRRALTMAEYARGLGRGAFDRVHRALFRAFFEDGRDIGDRDVLLDIGRSAGLAHDAAAVALEDPALVAHVLADQRLAAELGLEGVPALVLRRQGEPFRAGRLVSGAQPAALLRRAIEMMAEGATSGGGGAAMHRRLPLSGG